MQSFGLSLIYVVCDIDETQQIQHDITKPVVRGHLRERKKLGTISQDHSTQQTYSEDHALEMVYTRQKS